MPVNHGLPAPGDVFVTRTGGFVGWLIRRLTHSTVNHAGVFVGDGLLVEADPRDGLRKAPWGKYAGAIWSALPASAAQRVEIVKWSEDRLGVGYSFLDIVALFLALAAHIPTPAWAERRLSRPDRLICSQAVVLALRAAGIDPCPGKESGEVTPADLLAFIDQ